MRPAIWVLIVLLLGPTIAVAQRSVVMNTDSSDWWSVVNTYNLLDFSQPGLNVKHRLPPPPAFEIFDTSLGRKQFQTIAAQLGRAVFMQRGDAASARSQVCYTSTGDSPITLIFEQASDGLFSLYLFEDGQSWKGEKYCVKSRRLSSDIQTGNGLQLGQSKASVESILGKPSVSATGNSTYVYEVKMKTDPRRLADLKQQHPSLSDDEFHSNFDYYFVDAYIEAHFSSSRLTYLSVTKSQTSP